MCAEKKRAHIMLRFEKPLCNCALVKPVCEVNRCTYVEFSLLPFYKGV